MRRQREKHERADVSASKSTDRGGHVPLAVWQRRRHADFQFRPPKRALMQSICTEATPQAPGRSRLAYGADRDFSTDGMAKRRSDSHVSTLSESSKPVDVAMSAQFPGLTMTPYQSWSTEVL